jgi:hypothetical protein
MQRGINLPLYVKNKMWYKSHRKPARETRQESPTPEILVEKYKLKNKYAKY